MKARIRAARFLPYFVMVAVMVMLVTTLPVVTGCAPGAPEEAPPAEVITLKVHSNHPGPPSSAGAAVQYFVDEVTKRTNGAVEFELYWSNALAGPAESLELAQKGVVDIICSCAMYWPGKFPINHFEYSFPFGPTDTELVVKAKRQMYNEFPEIAAQWTPYNTIFLGGITWGYYEILSKTPANTIDDFKGKKVGMIGRWFGKWFEPIGAVPVVCGAADRYVNLQSGVQDMDLLAVDMQYSNSLHEQAKYLVLIGAGSFIPNDMAMNLESFNKLSPEIQKVLLEVGEDMEIYTAKYIKDIKEQSIAQMEAEGVTVIDFPKAEREKWANMLADVPAELAQEMEDAGYPGWEIQRRWQEITAELGYEWPREWAVKK